MFRSLPSSSSRRGTRPVFSYWSAQDAGILLALEGATGAVYPGVTFREVHDAEGPTRLNFWACWRQANCNRSLRPFLDMLRERYPDIVGAPALGSV
jgi:hypothetical protein